MRDGYLRGSLFRPATQRETANKPGHRGALLLGAKVLGESTSPGVSPSPTVSEPPWHDCSYKPADRGLMPVITEVGRSGTHWGRPDNLKYQPARVSVFPKQATGGTRLHCPVRGLASSSSACAWEFAQ